MNLPEGAGSCGEGVAMGFRLRWGRSPADRSRAPGRSRPFGVATMLCVGALVLASCSALGIDSSDDESDSAGGKEVVFWSSHGEPDIDYFKEMVADYNSTDPESPVKLQQVTGEETDVAQLMTAVRGGTGPDVYLLDRFTVAQRAEAGLIQPLSDFMSEDGGVEDFANQYIDFAWAEAQFDGQPYALPFDTDTRALYYNKKMLQDAGVDLNEFDPANGPITLDRATQISEQINKTDDSGAYTQMGFVPWYDQGWHYTWGFDFGGSFYDADQCQVTPTDPAIVNALQWEYDYANQFDPKKVQAFLSTNAQCTGPLTCEAIPPAQHPFITQKLALNITGNWFLKTIDKYAPDLDYGVTYIPTPSEGDQPSTWAGGWSVVIPEGAQNAQGAWDFMKWWAGEDGQREYYDKNGSIPTLTNLLSDQSLFSGNLQLFGELTEVAQSRPPLPVGALYWDELTAANEAVLLNREQPEPALEEVQSRVQPQLDEFCPLE
jgi:multiple sugar transport system substrate-binding protein